MEFIHRRRLTLPLPQHHSNPFSMHPFPVLGPRDLPGPPPPRPPLPIPPLRHTENSAKKELLKTGLIIMATISAAVLIGILYRIFRAKLSRGRDMRRTSDDDGPIIFATQEDFVDGDQGPGMDHHVWFINTVGLHQSVIDSISFFVYRKDENLVEGRTECSVCLSEFQEGESLRLLPKCSHAFHLPCIDTWLRSHKNCPLCRAPIFRGSFDASLGLPVTSTSESSSMEETQIENSDNSGGETREERNGDGGVSVLPVGDETDDVNSNINSSHSVSKNHSQPVRRSVSLDFSSAPAICHTVANFMPQKHEGDSDAHLQPKKSKLESVVAKQGSGRSLSIGRQMISSSIGRSLQKGPISMKRSFSTSGKCTSYRVFRHGKSQDTILPL